MKISEIHLDQANVLKKKKDQMIRQGNVSDTLAASARENAEYLKAWTAAIPEQKQADERFLRRAFTPFLAVMAVMNTTIDIGLSMAERAKPGTADKVQPIIRRVLGQ